MKLIHKTAILGSEGFSFKNLKRKKANFGIILMDGVEIGAYSTVDKGITQDTFIGNDTKIDHHCYIGHDTIIGKKNTIANGCSIEGYVTIGDNNKFGSHVVVQRRVKIGSNCKFGSGAVVFKDIPDNSIVVGFNRFTCKK